jgi:hypothetical protein
MNNHILWLTHIWCFAPRISDADIRAMECAELQSKIIHGYVPLRVGLACPDAYKSAWNSNGEHDYQDGVCTLCGETI